MTLNLQLQTLRCLYLGGPPDMEQKATSGVDVIITIFCDFSQFSAKKLAFFLNTNVMINFFQNLASFCVNFLQIFSAKIFKKL
jgi:hypothetical protein